MPLKAVLETLDGLNEGQAGLYVESDGKFFLDLDTDSLKEHPGTKPLVVAYERTKSGEANAKAEAAALKAKITELEKGAPDTAATQAKLTALQEQLQAAEAKAGDWQTKYTSITRDQALQTALQSSGITNQTFLRAAVRELAEKVKLGEDGAAYVESENGMGPKVLADYVKGWVASEGKDYVTPPQGGGAKGNDRPNPNATKGSFAGTPQERAAAIAAKFPDLAKG